MESGSRLRLRPRYTLPNYPYLEKILIQFLTIADISYGQPISISCQSEVVTINISKLSETASLWQCPNFNDSPNFFKGKQEVYRGNRDASYQ